LTVAHLKLFYAIQKLSVDPPLAKLHTIFCAY